MRKFRYNKYLDLYIFLIIISCNNSKKLEMISSKTPDFEDYTYWEKESITNIIKNNYITLPKYNIEKAIKTPKQGPYGSCVINSAYKAGVLNGDEITDYDCFLLKSKNYASAFLEHKNQAEKENSLEIFNSLVEFQFEFYKNNNKIMNNLLRECFEDGSNYCNIQEYLKKSYAKKTEIKCFDKFEDCSNAIKYAIKLNNPVLGSFNAGEDTKGFALGHTMNIVGYLDFKYFLILNTWGDEKSLGRISYQQMEICMKKKFGYTIMVFK